MTTRLAYSIDEACEVANTGRTYLYGEIASGELRAVKRGRRTMILADDLRAWLDRLPTIPVRSGDESNIKAQEAGLVDDREVRHRGPPLATAPVACEVRDPCRVPSAIEQATEPEEDMSSTLRRCSGPRRSDGAKGKS
jgi:excisionase family DNA binding protein